MIYQVVARRIGVGRGVWHDRPFGATAYIQQAREQYDNVANRYPRPTAVVILAGEDEGDLGEQFECYVNDKPCRTIEPTEEGIRMAMEFAPLKESEPYPRYIPHFADYSWGAEAFRGLLRLMTRVHNQEVGGKDDGESEAEPGGALPPGA